MKKRWFDDVYKNDPYIVAGMQISGALKNEKITSLEIYNFAQGAVKSGKFTHEYLNGIREKLFPNVRSRERQIEFVESDGGIENFPVYVESFIGGNISNKDVESLKAIVGKYVSHSHNWKIDN